MSFVLFQFLVRLCRPGLSQHLIIASYNAVLPCYLYSVLQHLFWYSLQGSIVSVVVLYN